MENNKASVKVWFSYEVTNCRSFKVSTSNPDIMKSYCKTSIFWLNNTGASERVCQTTPLNKIEFHGFPTKLRRWILNFLFRRRYRWTLPLSQIIYWCTIKFSTCPFFFHLELSTYCFQQTTLLNDLQRSTSVWN